MNAIFYPQNKKIEKKRRKAIDKQWAKEWRALKRKNLMYKIKRILGIIPDRIVR